VPLCGIRNKRNTVAQPRGAVNWSYGSTAKRSIDTVTVTVGGKGSTRLAAGQSIQSAIGRRPSRRHDHCASGTHHELLLMWKPVRLQGVELPRHHRRKYASFRRSPQ